MALDVARDELRYIRLGLLRLGRETHEGTQLIRKRADLEERVVKAASLPRGTVLRRERRGVYLAALLGVAGITLDGLDGLLRIVNSGADTSREL